MEDVMTEGCRVAKARLIWSLLVSALLQSSTGLGQSCPEGGLPFGGCTLPNPTQNCGCNPNVQPNQCFPDTSGPASWTDPGNSSPGHTNQTRVALKSARTTSYGTLPTGVRPNCSGVPSSPAPQVSVRVSGTGRILVDYDIPNYYCQNTGDWPVAYTCTNDIETTTDRMTLLLNGSPVLVGSSPLRAWIYYENGTWDTGIDLPCGASGSYSAAVKLLTSNAGVVSTFSSTQTLTGP
jgi:hypothetical protein